MRVFFNPFINRYGFLPLIVALLVQVVQICFSSMRHRLNMIIGIGFAVSTLIQPIFLHCSASFLNVMMAIPLIASQFAISKFRKDHAFSQLWGLFPRRYDPHQLPVISLAIPINLPAHLSLSQSSAQYPWHLIDIFWLANTVC